jgi:hypothetical protein
VTPAEGRFRPWLRSIAFTLGLSLLVAWGLGGEGRVLAFTVLGVAVFGLGLLYLLVPRGLHFAFGAAAGLAVYASLFVVLGHAQFPEAAGWARPAAFLLPVGAFLVMAWWRRGELDEVAEQQELAALDRVGRNARWLVLVGVVGVVSFMLPLNRLPPAWQGAALLAAMAAIALIIALSVKEVLRLLVDVALIIDEVGARARLIAVPAIAFLMMYSLLVVGFASAYRIADGLSLHPLFHDADGPTRLTYSDALHFSVATLSTVGYGDIRPQDDGVRVLASLEVVAGQLLLLFGVAEILRSRRVRSKQQEEEEREAGLDQGDGAGHSPGPPDATAPDRHEGAAGKRQSRRNPAASEPPDE